MIQILYKVLYKTFHSLDIMTSLEFHNYCKVLYIQISVSFFKSEYFIDHLSNTQNQDFQGILHMK